MALSIDRIDKPVTFWYEDYDGLMVPYERTDDYDNKWKSQHILHTNVIEETVGTYVPETWTFRFRKWLSCKLLKIPLPSPQSWMFRSINGGFPIVKYLVEQRNFTFNEACIIYSQMCEKCANHCLYELGDLQHKVNYNNIKMLCEHCETIDPEHYYRQRTMACYRALKNGDDIEKTFNEYSKHTRWRE